MRVAYCRLQNLVTLAWLAVALVVSLVVSAPRALADDPEFDPWVPVGFLIIRSTPDYAEARQIAERAARDLDIRLDLRGLIHDPAHGLTWPPEECAKDPLYPFPCYVARGRFDPGVYLSVESSDAYRSFKPGFFVVVAASGEPGSSELNASLADVKPLYPDAYVKQDEVYHGCMH